jgi:hypothetical protein
MRRFGNKTILFLALLFFFAVLASLGSRIIMRRGQFYAVKPGTTAIILGHSQPECGLNDALIAHTQNFSMGGEAYLYTYRKMQKLLDENPQIRTVYVSFANNQVESEMDGWTWESKSMYDFFSRYAYLMEAQDYKLLLRHNATTVLEGQAKSFREFLTFMATNRKNCLRNKNWGGYLYLERHKVDSLLKTDYLQKNRRKYSLSEVNIRYLRKMVSYARRRGVVVVLLRMPAHPLLPVLENEPQYQDIRRRYFSDIPYIDFMSFRATSKELGDFMHLNHFGATRFSVFFDSLQKAGVFSRNDRQKEVDAAIAGENRAMDRNL